MKKSTALDKTQLTEKQKNFAYQYVRLGGNRTRAAQAAGYSSPDNRTSYLLVNNPLIQQEIRKQREKQLHTETATLALSVMTDLMIDTKISPSVRFQAARWTLEAAGHNSNENKGLGFDQDKPLTEMSLNELQAFIAAGSQAVETMKQPRVVNADSARTFDNTQDSAQSDDADDLIG